MAGGVRRGLVATLWDYFCRFPYLPMLAGPEALQQTISWGVQRGLFAYALRDGESFGGVRLREPLASDEFPVVEGACCSVQRWRRASSS